MASGEPPSLGRRVIVIGGGNTAMDTARTVRCVSAPRSAGALPADPAEMPCLLEEVEGAEEEGIRFEFLVAPVKLARSGERHA